ncbi:tellurite resistance/C4-dicarboxylate transporter family protein [Streptomyces benahoarensis]|uniref:tellurite resistance/C4-dicarboxylate transporter family protein n=1 Tax=Streptomyces benahoarensis TaxID=2595054 RepID=UPI002035E175|nr:tellurite resistance/C4-dicarboxylate transporter family protein [Streptomyces benahoarensis]
MALGLAAVLWLLLVCGFVVLFLGHRRDWRVRAGTPPALTAVAATTVLGVRCVLLGAVPLAVALLLLAAVLWPGLLGCVLRHLTRRAPGAVFLICVATQGLAVLAAVLAPTVGGWLGWSALAAFLLGLVWYVGALACFDLRQVVTGAGDHWIAGGVMAISALAGSKLLASGVWSGGAAMALRAADFVLLAFALVWYVVLLCGEVVRPRPAYDARRWSTVFPLAMTAVAVLSTAVAAAVPWLDALGRVLLWLRGCRPRTVCSAALPGRCRVAGGAPEVVGARGGAGREGRGGGVSRTGLLLVARGRQRSGRLVVSGPGALRHGGRSAMPSQPTWEFLWCTVMTAASRWSIRPTPGVWEVCRFRRTGCPTRRRA